MFKAKPNMNNNIGLKTFSSQDDAVRYLNLITGFSMQAVDWRSIGKLIKS
jgi:hypothetical protein